MKIVGNGRLTLSSILMSGSHDRELCQPAPSVGTDAGRVGDAGWAHGD